MSPLALILLIGCTRPGSTGTDPITEGFEIGEEPPDFTLTNAEGDLVSLSDYPDQRVIVVGTASW
ncbi:MAG: hypothetical protein ACI8RZ_000175 [Myxococcota bacterium]